MGYGDRAQYKYPNELANGPIERLSNTDSEAWHKECDDLIEYVEISYRMLGEYITTTDLLTLLDITHASVYVHRWFPKAEVIRFRNGRGTAPHREFRIPTKDFMHWLGWDIPPRLRQDGDIEWLVDKICRSQGYTITIARSPIHINALVQIRDAVCICLRAEGWSLQQIGDFFQRHHTSIINTLRGRPDPYLMDFVYKGFRTLSFEGALAR